MIPLEQRIKDYADARWPDRDLKGRVRKLSEEFLDLMEAIAQEDETGIRLAAADMAIILMDIVALQGDSLMAWVEIKAKVLGRRVEAARALRVEAVNEEIGG